MATVQETKDKALGLIDSILTILNKFPGLSSTSTNKSANTSYNVLDFMLDTYKHTSGYDALINILSQFIATALPAIEISVKAILMSNMKNLISCSINPFISDRLLKEGFVFDLKQIDISNILKTCPLDTELGQYYYFGCDDMKLTDEVKNSEDFNCLVWYMKNKAVSREVWGMTENAGSGKTKKENGIITLEYNETALSLKDAEGNRYNTQTVYTNCLHVFIGNAKQIDDQGAETESINDDITSTKEELEELDEKLDEYKANLNELSESYTEQTIEYNEYNELYQYYNEEIEKINDEINDTQNRLEELNNEKQEISNEYKNSLSSLEYRSIQDNYYYKKTLIQFNYDYIYSLTLFDAKVVTAMLIDSLTNCLSISLNLSYSQKVIQEETLSIIKQVVETDDATVTDCFFTFSNDDYNAMLEKTESLRSGLLTIDNENISDTQVDTKKLLSSLNEISPSASKQEVTSIIEGTINEMTTTLSTSTTTNEGSLNLGINGNIIEQLMTSLVMAIVTSLLSPKVYILLLINLNTLGENTNFTMNDFMSQFKNLMVELIRSLRDQIIKYLKDELLKILKDLSKEVAVKIASEQAKYYTELIKSLVNCFGSGSSSEEYDNESDVTGAEIEETDEPETTEC